MTAAADALRTQMLKLSDFILDAEGSVRIGRMIDLSGLDKDVTVLCNKAISLPPADAMEIQPVMAELIGHVERLSIALKEFQEKTRK